MARPRKQFCVHGHDRTLPGAVTKDGNCYECSKARYRARYAASADFRAERTSHHLEYMRRRYADPEGRKGILAENERWRRENPDKAYISSVRSQARRSLTDNGFDPDSVTVREVMES